MFTTSKDESIQKALYKRAVSFCSESPYLVVLGSRDGGTNEERLDLRERLPLRVLVDEGSGFREVVCGLSAGSLETDVIQTTVSNESAASGNSASTHEISSHIERIQGSIAAMIAKLDIIVQYLKRSTESGKKPAYHILRMATALRNQVS